MNRTRFTKAHLAALALGAAIVLILLALAYGASDARAQPMCFATFNEADAILGEAHEESLIAEGMVGDNALHILISPTGTLTILATAPGRPTCILASGEAFGFVTPRPRPVPGQES